MGHRQASGSAPHPENFQLRVPPTPTLIFSGSCGYKGGGSETEPEESIFVFSLFTFACSWLGRRKVNLLSLFPDRFINRSFFSGLAHWSEVAFTGGSGWQNSTLLAGRFPL